MDAALKNILILGCSVLSVVVFLTVYQISKSAQIRGNANDSNYLINLANYEAAKNIKEQKLRLIAVVSPSSSHDIPGIGFEKFHDCYESYVDFEYYTTWSHGPLTKFSKFKLLGADPREQLTYALTYNAAISSHLIEEGVVDCH